LKDQIGYKIKKIRELRNYSQEFMAKSIGISQAAYSSIENCKTKLDDKKLKQIAEILKVDEFIIVNFSEEKFFRDAQPQKNNSSSDKIQELYERILKQKEEEISLLKKKLKDT
jgi:transcriptional regulator with XRE-family HTH domain